ncbi:dUTP diphosphatase [Ancylobacter amanitiformis]|uniref:Deoxyuridine 5'-triphosphate nucleotidohydrolase n=1 Tax=Ancylobacter amanitiformis TaxID=217069 RepID=A0ABU0LUL2_9HYPH|nr:dUTP diphosphatase [Ancylobacter amanitiformis]MDQ0512408.1 dUTP pyrophosphatase [Ancylobacter amanitiformis]
MTETPAFMDVPVLVLPHAEGLPLPTYATAGAAGLDLLAALPEGEALTLAPLARAAVPTGLCLALPDGYEGQVRPRSGLALKQGLTVLNAPGTVDADYRGEVKVLLINLGTEPVVLERGQRIAQLVVAPVTRIQLCRSGDLSETTRGSGGFGSTGLDARTISR